MKCIIYVLRFCDGTTDDIIQATISETLLRTKIQKSEHLKILILASFNSGTKVGLKS